MSYVQRWFYPGSNQIIVRRHYDVKGSNEWIFGVQGRLSGQEVY